MNNLSLIPIEDLFEELFSRFEHCVFSGMQVKIGGEDKIFTMRKWKGNSVTACGLASELQISIYNDHIESSEETEML